MRQTRPFAGAAQPVSIPFSVTRPLLATIGLVTLVSGCIATVPMGPEQIAAANSRADSQLRSRLNVWDQARLERLKKAELARLQAQPTGPQTAPELKNALQNGLYNCELKRQVEVSDVQADGLTATLTWGKQRYEMTAVQANTGALRLENADTGLVWISIVGKSMLLDTREGKQLANECNLIGLGRPANTNPLS